MKEKSVKTCSGRVVLVGAGPGDPGLITVMGLKHLERADVIIYDSLVNPALLGYAPESAERIDVGKRGGSHKYSQDQINVLLAEKAGEGKYVVRLKGGDPYLFGRGAEEVIYLGEHDVPVEVVSGVTSGVAAAATAGIPLTHRHCASTVTFVTGHEAADKSSCTIDYPALAKLVQCGGTLCFYMGVSNLASICRSLADAGLPAMTPSAMIMWGTWPSQRCVRSTLGELVGKTRAEGFGSPAIIIVGEVTALRGAGLDYFIRRPLFGRRVMITRSIRQCRELTSRLEELGAMVIEAPAISILPCEDWSEVDQSICNLVGYDWLVLTSVNGVRYFAERLVATGKDSRSLSSLKVAVIGDATARVLKEAIGVTAACLPERFVAESLAEAMTRQYKLAGARVLMLRADIARPTLAERLTEAGALVDDIVIYRTRPAESIPSHAMEMLRSGSVDWVTFTSSSTVAGLLGALGEERSLLNRSRLISIGPVTSQTMEHAGLPVAAEAGISNIRGLIDALLCDASHQHVVC